MITPLNRNVLVKKQIIEDGIDQVHGIYVMGRSNKDNRYTVIALGAQCEYPLLPGDVVIIGPTVPAEIVTINGGVLKFVNETHISGKEVEE
jgi:co-chaperonin GroES (HSP10)